MNKTDPYPMILNKKTNIPKSYEDNIRLAVEILREAGWILLSEVWRETKAELERFEKKFG